MSDHNMTQINMNKNGKIQPKKKKKKTEKEESTDMHVCPIAAI